MASASDYRRQLVGILTQLLARAEDTWGDIVNLDLDEPVALPPEVVAYASREVTSAGAGASQLALQLLDYLFDVSGVDRSEWLRRAAADTESKWQ